MEILNNLTSSLNSIYNSTSVSASKISNATTSSDNTFEDVLIKENINLITYDASAKVHLNLIKTQDEMNKSILDILV